ncbi:MAG: carbohydrate-binding domain-containing protein [Gracilibacteraceae bacterium]|nr:carbohydrate-binding domain-containing protein [Gracilibacteraceae bacterium]
MALVLGLALAGCGAPGGESGGPTGAAGANVQPPNASIDMSAAVRVYEYAPEDADAAWDEAGATTVVLTDGAARVSGPGASFADGALTIGQAGTYALSGTLAGGQVLIDAGENDLVRLVLSGVSLYNETGPAIYAPQAGKTVLILADGSENTVSGAGYGENTDDPDAAIFAQDDLSVTGQGTLTVSGGEGHGIRAQDVLAITGGVLRIEAAGDALRGRDGVAIQGGEFTLNAGGDGIQSNNDEDGAKGFVIIGGGAYIIQAQGDGIQAQTALTVAGGSLRITTGGGSADAGAAEDGSPGGKGLKAGTLVYLTGGEISVDAADDAVHSNGDLSVTAGRFYLQTGDDGLHADALLEISGGEIDIPVCYEGIEGLSVTISGGDIVIAAADDAVNAAGGAGGETSAGPRGRDSFAVSGNIFVRVTGGALDLFAGGDGIDANGNIFLEGGAVRISGPSQGMEGAVEMNGVMLVSGGELITAGSVTNVSAESAQAVLLVSYTQPQAAGSVIALKDAGGETLLEYTSKTGYTASGFTSPALTVGETYALFIDGEKKTDIRLQDLITSIADDGGAYSGGQGGGRGNWGGRPDGAPGEGRMPPGEGSRPEGTPSEGWAPGEGGRPEGTPPDGWTPPGEGGRPEGAPPEGRMPPEGGGRPDGTPPEGRTPPDEGGRPDGTPSL